MRWINLKVKAVCYNCNWCMDIISLGMPAEGVTIFHLPPYRIVNVEKCPKCGRPLWYEITKEEDDGTAKRVRSRLTTSDPALVETILRGVHYG